MIGLTDHELDLRTALEGQRRAEFITGLLDMAVYYTTHPDAPLPDSTILGTRVYGDSDSAREAQVDAFADEHGVHAEWKNGTYTAAREFGPLRLQAHYTTAATKQANARRVLHGTRAA